ncbi:MAG: LLM class F420-dependent oxidoreductase [Ilumatobacteraceae bacterium]
MKVGIQLQPQATTVATLRRACREADAAGADSIWVWDHFFSPFAPFTPDGSVAWDPDAAHFEAYTLLAAMAADTSSATLGALVTCNSYRNPNLLADMARTIDHISEGRFVLGIGAGWAERDYTEYGFDFLDGPARLRALGRDLPTIKERLRRLSPPPIGPLPIVIGGSGERVTLRLVAEHADGWHTRGPVENWAAKSAVLDQWCERIGRDPSTIERIASIKAWEIDRDSDAYADAGANHLVLYATHPYDMSDLRRLMDRVDRSTDQAR